MKSLGSLIDVAAALFCIGAGVYLLQYNGAPIGDATGGTSWFEIIGHGMGLYFIGKGLYVGRSASLQRRIAEGVERQP